LRSSRAGGGSVSAALYKWTDANGRVIYSDQPPIGNVKVETINAAAASANPNAVKELAAKDAELKKAKQARAMTRRRRTRRASTRTSCARIATAPAARCQRSATRTRSSSTRPTPKASAWRWTTPLALRERQRLDAWIRDNCKS
jgi:hypothetical protein